MRKHFFVVIVLFSLISFSVLANTERQLYWMDQDTSASARSTLWPLPTFVGASVSDSTRIPMYAETLPCTPGNTYQLGQYTIAVLPDAEVVKLQGQRLPPDFALRTARGTDKGAVVEHVELCPLRFRQGRYERIVKFELVLVPMLQAQVQAVRPAAIPTATASSVLAGGRWVKLRVSETGVYQVARRDVEKWGLGALEAVSAWSNGCKNLPRDNRLPALEDLQQLPVKVEGDRLLFYAEAKVAWGYDQGRSFFNHELNEFSPDGYVFLTNSQPVKRVEVDQVVYAPATTESEYDYVSYHEQNEINLLRSGRNFYGERFDKALSLRSIKFTIPYVVEGSPVKVRASVIGASTMGHSYSINLNGEAAQSIPIRALQPNEQATQGTALFDNLGGATPVVSVNLVYNAPSATALGYLDYVTINTRARIVVGKGQLPFRDSRSVGQQATQFGVESLVGEIRVWKVTNMHAVAEMPLTNDGGGVYRFTAATAQLEEFVAFNSNMLLTPKYVDLVPNQDLHRVAERADYVIVSHPLFWAEAQRLATWHREHNGMTVQVVSTNQVYNEFSSGIPDVSAIRNYMRMLYRRGVAPDFLLLFGNGSFINMEGRKNTSHIPTFQSENSLDISYSFVSDDYFGVLDTTNLGDQAAMLQLGIGRFPVVDAHAAAVVVNKVERYYQETETAWMNRMVFIADDKDGNIHMAQTQQLAQQVHTKQTYYDVNRIFFDNFEQVSTPAGERYPDATRAINSAMNSGALLVNYVGHANQTQMAHELVITKEDIEQWNNRARLPLFVTATCEFSRYDDYDQVSAGETTLLHDKGGAIAMLSTTRLVYSDANFDLNSKFIEMLLQPGADGLPRRLGVGELLRQTKNNIARRVNQFSFTLLGDPALQLHTPTVTIHIDSINGRAVAQGDIDTLRALARVAVQASLQADADLTYMAAFDKSRRRQTLGNGGQEPFEYYDQGSRLFSGRSSVRNRTAVSRFVVPKDIIYSYGPGRITYFARTTSGLAAGAFEQVIVGGVAKDFVADTTPPAIRMFMNNENFVAGGTTNTAPIFMAHLTDSSGINLTGSGLGRDMTLYLHKPGIHYVLNNYYTAIKDSYTQGTVEFPVPPLDPGMHTATLRVFDVHNNMAEQNLDFNVAHEDKFTLSHVLNYPNPFTQKTAFFFEHNRPFVQMQVLIQVYTITGKLVKTLYHYIPESSGSLRSDPIEWDGRDDYGAKLAKGVYMYKVKVGCNTGEQTEKLEKLVVLN